MVEKTKFDVEVFSMDIISSERTIKEVFDHNLSRDNVRRVAKLRNMNL